MFSQCLICTPFIFQTIWLKPSPSQLYWLLTLHITPVKLLYSILEWKVQYYNIDFKNLTGVKTPQIFNKNPRTPDKTKKNRSNEKNSSGNTGGHPINALAEKIQKIYLFQSLISFSALTKTTCRIWPHQAHPCLTCDIVYLHIKRMP